MQHLSICDFYCISRSSIVPQLSSLTRGQFQPCQEVDDRIYTLCNPLLVLTNQLTLFLFGTITLMLVEIAKLLTILFSSFCYFVFCRKTKRHLHEPLNKIKLAETSSITFGRVRVHFFKLSTGSLDRELRLSTTVTSRSSELLS